MPDDVFNVLMVGVGGQGIVLSSDVLTTAAMLSAWTPRSPRSTA